MLFNFSNTQGSDQSTSSTKESRRPRAVQTEPIPEAISNEFFIPGYLLTQIGKQVRVEFLIGNSINDRAGVLEEVGASYIIIRLPGGDEVLCDMFAIKFVTIYSHP